MSDSQQSPITGRLRNAIEIEAERIGFLYPEVAHKLIDPDSVALDESGRPVGVRSALNDLASRRPALLREARPVSGGTPPGRASDRVSSSAPPTPRDSQAEVMKDLRRRISYPGA